MPTVLRTGGYRFFFFSLEGREPPHVHVENAEKYPKIWLDPISVAQSKGFRSHELSEIIRIVRKTQGLFLERWNEHFKRKV
jgi:hypothetical protein